MIRTWSGTDGTIMTAETDEIGTGSIETRSGQDGTKLAKPI